MEHNWDKYFDTESEYWEKVQKIYEENDHFPKIVVKNRNLHHKFMRAFSRLEGTEIDNDKDNLVSLDLADHYLVHYYLWKCTKTGFRNKTGLAFRFMNKSMQKYVNDEIVELLAQEYKKALLDCKPSKETKKKIAETLKGRKRPPMSEEQKKKISESMKKSEKFKKAMESEETRKKISEGHKGKKQPWTSERNRLNKGKPSKNKGKKHTEESKKHMSEAHKGKHWRLENGKRVYY